MNRTYSFSLETPEGDRIALGHRLFDGVETERGTVETFDFADARNLHASLGQALAKAEANHAKLMERRRADLVARRAELECQIERIDAELGKPG